jgi:hypothetical protein
MNKPYQSFLYNIGFLQVFAGPFIAGLIFGFLAYTFIGGIAGLIVAMVFALFGLVLGLVMATRDLKKKKH